MNVDQLLVSRIERLPPSRKAEVLDFVEFLLARTEAPQGEMNPWAPLLHSLDQFSDDFMEERAQPVQQARDSLFDE